MNETYVTVPSEPTDEMIDAGLKATKGYLRLNGSQLTQNREKMRLRFKAMCAVAPPVDVEVVVPHAEFSFPQAEDSERAWVSMGLLFEQVQEDLGIETAISVLLSRLTREMRRHLGIEGGAEVLRSMAATMAQAAKYDR